MKKHALLILVLSLLVAGAQPLFAVSKETLQMMQQLDALQQAVQNLERTVDTQNAVLKTLIEQASDNVNKIKSNMDELRDATQKNLATSNAHLDSMTSQIQALSESLDEAKARIGKLGEQLTQTQNIIQTITAPPQQPAGAAPGTPIPGAQGPPGAQAAPPPKPNIPDPDSLYNSGLTDYNGGQYDLAIQAFLQYLQYYGETDRASNAQFYIGDSYYFQKKYNNAISEYDKCIERGGNKAAGAQLKKGFALLELGERSAGAKELRSLIQQNPNSHEAELARQRLRKLGYPTSTARRSN
ncbi:MAG: tetratricopeptide repeat protein [Terriglobia bacterium]